MRIVFYRLALVRKSNQARVVFDRERYQSIVCGLLVGGSRANSLGYHRRTFPHFSGMVPHGLGEFFSRLCGGFSSRTVACVSTLGVEFRAVELAQTYQIGRASCRE